MTSVVRLIATIIKFALALSIAGELTTVTRVMLGYAVRSHVTGGISFVKMNQMLLSGKNFKCLDLYCDGDKRRGNVRLKEFRKVSKF